MTERNSQELVDMILADPPQIHIGTRTGVWSTAASCYRFLSDNTSPGARTLETGCGISTIVLAARGALHTCVTPGQAEADGVVRWCEGHGIGIEKLTFRIGSSANVLPTLERTPLDLVFIDGAHQFPMPVIDWFYTAPRLRVGGLIVLDDVQLPAPRLVADYMAKAPVVRTIERTPKWWAFQVVGAIEHRPGGNQKESLTRGGALERLGRRADAVLQGLRQRARPDAAR